jgi:tetratricopeptide (TPR) repeat protein
VLFTNSTNGLSIHHEIIARTIAGKHPALAWIHYQSYDSPGFRLLAAVVQNGAETAIARYRQANPALRGLDEGQINDLGYQLLRTKRVGDALEVFKLNVEAFPGSANAYDSLGEAYIVKGEKELAIKNYQRSVELNPGNASGVEALKKLREDKRD